MPWPKPRRISSTEPVVGERVDQRAHVVAAQAVFRHHVAQLALVGAAPVFGAALEVGHVLPRDLHRLAPRP